MNMNYSEIWRSRLRSALIALGAATVIYFVALASVFAHTTNCTITLTDVMTGESITETCITPGHLTVNFLALRIEGPTSIALDGYSTPGSNYIHQDSYIYLSVDQPITLSLEQLDPERSPKRLLYFLKGQYFIAYNLYLDSTDSGAKDVSLVSSSQPSLTSTKFTIHIVADYH